MIPIAKAILVLLALGLCSGFIYMIVDSASYNQYSGEKQMAIPEYNQLYNERGKTIFNISKWEASDVTADSLTLKYTFQSKEEIDGFVQVRNTLRTFKEVFIITIVFVWFSFIVYVIKGKAK